MFRLAHRRMVLLPTLFGWAIIFSAATTGILLWWFKGEAFLSRTERLPAAALVVEGWIGPEGISAAAKEFAQGGYRYIIATSGMSGDRWSRRRWSYADEAAQQLVRMGIPSDRVILAKPTDTETHRTFEAAEAVLKALRERDIHPKAVNIFTLGAHARRSRLVFAKVLRPGIEIGVISWTPNGYETGRWWQDSDRAVDFIKESLGYAFEVLLNSGRGFVSARDTALSTDAWSR
jgi:DUF218 domain-containing protein